MLSQTNKGVLIVLSGASGAGKSTVLKAFFEKNPDARYSVSLTTRVPREGEVDGKHYHFTTKENFREYIDNNKLLEWAEYAGNLYGTPSEPIEQAINDGSVIILEIEVVGALQVKKHRADATLVFMSPSSIDEVERRLRSRNTETEETIQKRINIAREEYKSVEEYRYLVTNDSVEHAVEELEAIIKAERCLVKNKIKSEE